MLTWAAIFKYVRNRLILDEMAKLITYHMCEEIEPVANGIFPKLSFGSRENRAGWNPLSAVCHVRCPVICRITDNELLRTTPRLYQYPLISAVFTFIHPKFNCIVASLKTETEIHVKSDGVRSLGLNISEIEMLLTLRIPRGWKFQWN